MPDHKPSIEHQRRLYPLMQEVVKKEIIKWLDAGVIYPIAEGSSVCPVQCLPKKRGMILVPNEKNDLVPMRPVTGWRVCMDYQKLNAWTEKDHFPMPFMDQMLDRLAEKGCTIFLMVIRGIIRFLLHQKIKRKPPLLVNMGPLRSKECHLGCAMHPHFRDV